MVACIAFLTCLMRTTVLGQIKHRCLNLLSKGAANDLHCLILFSMLLALGERQSATTMDEQRAVFVCGHLPPMAKQLFAADELRSKVKSAFKGSVQTMRLLSRRTASPFCDFSSNSREIVPPPTREGRSERAVSAKNDAEQASA